MRCKADENFAARRLAQLLFDFGGVAVLGNVIRLHALVHLAKVGVGAGLCARTGHTGFCVDDDVFLFGQPRVQQRRGGKD